MRFGRDVLAALLLMFPTILLAQDPTLVEPTPTTTDLLDQDTGTPIPTLDPSDGGEPCAAIADAVSESNSDTPIIDAEDAYRCLQSVPFDSQPAVDTINAFTRVVQFQSTLSYLKNPPEGYSNPGVDILQGLDDIKNKAQASEYNNEYDFEADISRLLARAYDGHLAFEGNAFSGAFRWRRSRQAALIVASVDGGDPKIYAMTDFNETATDNPSPVTQINGRDALVFLTEESDLNPYHDPDARINSMFYLPNIESYGLFVNPRNYPGPELNMTFENGTTSNFRNSAYVQDPSVWSSISDGADFYRVYITPSDLPSQGNAAAKSLQHEPEHLLHKRDTAIGKRNSPQKYPEPFVAHSSSDVLLAGYFMDRDNIGTIGVLLIGTFSTGQDDAASQEFQVLVERFLTEAKSRNAAKIVIDVRDNGGGNILLGYDTFKQFFPDQEPFGASRFRANDAVNLVGSQISTLSYSTRNGAIYTTPFNYHSFVDESLDSWTDWEAMYGPADFNGDKFTNLLRYNLSDPLITSSERFSIGITITGYGDRSDITQAPFKAEDIIILSDGVCASTCSLFLEFMVQQAGVRTFTIGGRPQPGPMQPVGGTKGSLVLTAGFLAQVAGYVVERFDLQSSSSDYNDFLPIPFGINIVDATINMQDNIRQGEEQNGMPTQFLNDTANCRVYYTPEMYFNGSEVWGSVADIVWANNNILDGSRCVPGSSEQEQKEKGNTPNEGGGNPTTGGPQTSSSTAAASAVIPPDWSIVPFIVCGTAVLVSALFGASLI